MTPDPRNPWRLADGGRVDRDAPLNFQFNGAAYVGYRGDTLASALLANGVRVVARSFKFHRPRGIFTAGEEEPCALVEVGEGAARVPNSRATLVPLAEGLVATSQNGWPSVGFDLGRIVDFTHPLWPAGFYNKTFKWPRWSTWEGLVRRAAGLGRTPPGPDPDHYEQVNAHCDLLVCGGGAAGLTAALAAGRAGLRVILVEQDPACGGVLNHQDVLLDGRPAADWVRETTAQLRKLGNVIVLERTVVAGVYDHNVTTLLQTGFERAWRECLWIVRPRHVLLAAGSIEQGLIFPNNDRPGIMLAGAVRRYLNEQAVCPGRHIVVATNNDSAYQTVFDLARCGIPVGAVVDLRGSVDDALRARTTAAGAELLSGARIADTHGFSKLRSVHITTSAGRDLGRRRCDLLAVSGGWSPRAHLLAHARGSLRFAASTQSFLPDRLPPDWSVVGAAAGTHGVQATLDEANAAARRICESLGKPAPDAAVPRVTQGLVETPAAGPAHPLVADLADATVRKRSRRQWIDLAHDVTLGDAELAVREGFVSVEHFKRYTTTGMSVDQGKTGNLNAFIALGALTGRDPGDVGTTTFRPPYVPVTLGAIAGRRTGEFYALRRLLPAHAVHQRLDGRFEDYGWQRPDCYPQAGEPTHDAVNREVQTVRSAVGVFDNSPLGKLDVRGPDAARFLDRVYINNVSGLAVGRVRYGLMLNENGVIIDDGVFARLAEDHFLLNTTSGGAGRIAALLEEWLQCEWPDLRVLVDDQTTQWANFTLAGPRARQVLTTLGTDIDLSPAALPHMAVAEGAVAGLRSRVVRVSFSGEMSFEVNVPAQSAGGFFEAILQAGAAHGIAPYGVESLMVLRAEKGYLHIGTDTDGSATPDDVGWGAVARSKPGDFIGKRSLFREANLAADRKQFVGLEPFEPQRALRPGGHLLRGPGREAPALTDGWVTSACFSPTLGRHIGLGVLRGGRERMGEIVTVCDEAERFPARVVSPCFYDPDNERLKD
ncbi:MAG: sarcosine oxidase subunit alpha family protein [Lysobacterales bacterium]